MRVFILFTIASSISAAFIQNPSSNHKVKSYNELILTKNFIPNGISKTDTSIEFDEISSNNPSSTFGKPLDEKTKEFNQNVVSLIKTTIFDAIYSSSSSDVRRDYARFYALETIARMPYFSYLSVLHLYETLGWWRKANYLKIHFAESWNELHHLLIMEELGGNEKWLDRFVAQHIAVGYYWFVVAVYMANPTMAYNLNQAVEEHAYETYASFLETHETLLKTIPAPTIAKEYYRDGDLYMFDEFQTDTCQPRRPKCDTLYDTFVNIRDDEKQHVNTMVRLQEDGELINAHDVACDVEGLVS